MSTSPVDEWTSKGIKWQYIHNSVFKSITVQANGEMDLPFDGHVFKYPRIVITSLGIMADSPYCGFRIRTDPNYDSMDLFTIINFMLGFTRPEPLVYAVVPPQSPPGIYMLKAASSWEGLNNMKISVYNKDPNAPHTFFAVAYILAVTKGDEEEKNSKNIVGI